ncbi:helix-turn-helix transcriptional regulator [Anaerolineales bacterium HSG6]|nr:helix-turn-helix transcriptional regulator [Anaerolineales bacterium HSG6]
MDRIGEKLHTLRTQHGLTTRELAANLDVAHSSIGHIETGQRSPSAKLILKIARFFEVSIDTLMKDELEL